MVLSSKIFIKPLVHKKNQKVQIKCGQFLKYKKKNCPQCCLQGVQSIQGVKISLRLLKLDFKGVFKCCEQFTGVRSNPDPTPASIRLRAWGQDWIG